MLRVYTASRFNRGGMWLDIQNDKEFKHHFHARWLRHWKNGTEETPDRAMTFWPENLEDIQTADVVLLYSAPSDVQGGALVEAGAALAYGKILFICGSNEAYRSWIYHPNVIQYPSLQAAINALDTFEDNKNKRFEYLTGGIF